MKKTLSLLLALALVLTSFVPTFAADNSKKEEQAVIKNVIMMIPDGMSFEAFTLARWFTPDWKFALDEILTGSVRTNNSDVPMADSAPAATAMSTGYKSEAPYIGCYPQTFGMAGAKNYDPAKADMPIATVLEAAKYSGRSTGVVSTSRVNHATPAAFYSHHPSRKEYDTLIEQGVYQNIDVVLGAGTNYLTAEKRNDGEDLISVLKDKGYTFITKRNELLNTKADKLWGLFAKKDLAYDLEADKTIEPSLEEMTKKAIEILSKNENGFFLIVEGSEIDWAGHSNDPVNMVGDILAYDKAVKAALDFAKTNKDTVVISAADHGTGGITMGNYHTSGTYTKNKLGYYTDIIKNAKGGALKASSELDEDRTNIREVVKKYFGITDLTDEEVKFIKEYDSAESGIGLMISERSGIGWTTHGHVGGDIGLYCYSSNPNVPALSGTIMNNEIGEYIARVMNFDLDALTEKLFIPARPALEAKGAKVEWKNVSKDKEKKNHELIVTKGSNTYRFPVNKNIVYVNGQAKEFDGLTLFNEKAVFLPKAAIDLVK